MLLKFVSFLLVFFQLFQPGSDRIAVNHISYKTSAQFSFFKAEKPAKSSSNTFASAKPLHASEAINHNLPAAPDLTVKRIHITQKKLKARIDNTEDEDEDEELTSSDAAVSHTFAYFALRNLRSEPDHFSSAYPSYVSYDKDFSYLSSAKHIALRVMRI